jgi:hypothetical protein
MGDLGGLDLGATGLCGNATFIGGGESVYPGGYNTGLFQIALPGGSFYAFCTDLGNYFQSGTHCYEDGYFPSWQVAYLLYKYPATSGLTTTEVAARQAALWHYTDGYDLSSPSDVETRYVAILADVQGLPPEEQVLYGASNVQLRITPSAAYNIWPDNTHTFTVTLTIGGLPAVGYTITPTVSAGSVLPTTGATDANGQAAFVLTLTSMSGDEITVDISAETEVTLKAGSRFLNESNPTTSQRLVLGEETTQTYEASATKTWLTSESNLLVHKFHDYNMDRDQDQGEPDLAGWEFVLEKRDESNWNEVSSGATASNGDALLPWPTSSGDGDYRVKETLKTGWQVTTDDGTVQTCNHQSGSNDCGDEVNWTNDLIFGNAHPGYIQVKKYLDIDRDGKRDTGEPWLPNWHYTLKQEVGGAWEQHGQGSTDSSGTLLFEGLSSDDYRVYEDSLTDAWECTTCVAGTPYMQVDDLDDEEFRVVEFGNCGALSISGMKWNDIDGEGDKDTDESGLLGWEISLKDSSGAVISTTTTSEDGTYSFHHLTPGVYTVTETSKDGWSQTYPNAPGTHEVTLTGADAIDIDFGNQRSATSMLAFKFEDLNKNGEWDEGEQPLSGWELCTSNGTICDTTNEYGFAAFYDLIQGTYNITETLQPGWGTYPNNLDPGQTGYAYPGYVGDEPGPYTQTITLADGSQYLVETAPPVGNTWTYTVTEISGKDLSHWVLGIVTCVKPDHIESTTPGASIGLDPSTGFTGVKWDITNDSWNTGVFTITLDNNYPPGTVEALMKAGTYYNTGDIYGPICGPLFGNWRDEGKIIVDKVTVPSDDAEFDFALSGPDVSKTFVLSNTAAPYDSGSLASGTYSVTETIPEGWTLTGATCSDGNNPDEINLGAGETVTCTFTNTKKAKIVVAKKTDPAGSIQTFSFTEDIVAPALTDGGSAYEMVQPGIYTVREGLTAGWTVEDITCTDGTEGNTYSRRATYNVTAGDVVTCTFTNTENGSLTVTKVANWNGFPSTQYFDIRVTPEGGEGDYFRTVKPGGTSTFPELPCGTYTVTETSADPIPLEAWVVEGNDVKVVVPCGGAVTATITNTQMAKIFVDKVTDPEEDPTDFDFDLMDSGTVTQSFVLSDTTAPYDSGWLVPGAYSVTEAAETGWSLTTAICTDESEVDNIDLSPGEVITCTFTNHHDIGDLNVTKAVEWNDVPADETQVFTICVKGPAPDETETCKDFAYDGGILTWQDLPYGVYTVTEDPSPGAEWTVTGSPQTVTVPGVCAESNPANAITPSSTDECPAVATITNTHKLGGLAVTKIVDWNGATEATGQIFTICVTMPNGEDPVAQNGDEVPPCEQFSEGETVTWYDLVPGDYKVTETGAAPHPLEAWTVAGSDVTVTVPAGEVVSTTITNTHKTPSLDLTKETTPLGINEATHEITFTITVENTGPTALASIPLTDEFEAPSGGQLTYLRSTPSANSPTAGTAGNPVLVTWNDILAANLNPGDSVQVLVAFELPDTATFTGTNTARVAGALDIYGTPANEDEDAVELKNVPTSVTLDKFEGFYNGVGVLLEWATLTEVNHFGFNLYRSSTGSLGDEVQIINEDIIPGTGGPNTGATYDFLDTNVVPGLTYTYWLEDVDNEENKQIRKSPAVTVPIPAAGPEGGTMVYLPVIIR